MSSDPRSAEDASEGNNPVTADENGPKSPELLPMSKNQLKRLKRKEKWLERKAQKRKEEKQKKKRRFAEMREKGVDMGPSRKSLKKNAMKDSACKQRVVIDCSFDSYMTEKDVMNLVQQLQHSYAANRRAENPLQLYVCGIDGKTKQRLDSIGDYKGWDIYKEEKNYTEVFAKEDIVYLSSESPNTLETLDEKKVYAIGGLVDHNHHKGLCHRLAEEKGLAHAQLPISEFLQLKSRKVLTINHVFEILLQYTETTNWQTAFLKVLPQRKGFSVKDCADASKDKSDSTQQADQKHSEVRDRECEALESAQSLDSQESRDNVCSDKGSETYVDSCESKETTNTSKREATDAGKDVQEMN